MTSFLKVICLLCGIRVFLLIHKIDSNSTIYLFLLMCAYQACCIAVTSLSTSTDLVFLSVFWCPVWVRHGFVCACV